MAALTAILGAVMVASSLGVKLIGLPRQAVRNWRRKTAPHASRVYAILGTLSYASTAAYTFIKGDWLTGLVNLPGVAVIAVLLWQVMRYPDAK